MSALKDRLKPLVKSSKAWPLVKHLLPKYHRPLLRLGLAKAKGLLGPNDHELALAYAALGGINLSSDYLDDTVAACNAAIAHDPQCVAAYIARGEALLRQGQRQAALAGLEGVRGLRSNDAEVHIALADAFLRHCDALEAIHQYELARELTPSIEWPSGQPLIDGDGLEIAKNLMAHYFLQSTPAKQEALLRSAIAHAEAALRHEETPEALEVLRGWYLVAGRHSDFTTALQRSYALRERQPAFQEFKRTGPETEFLPDICSRSVGATGWLTTFVKKKILLGTNERLVLCAPPEQVVNPTFLSYFKPYVDILETPEAIEAVSGRKSVCRLPFEFGLRFDGPPKYISTIQAEVNIRWARENRPPLLKLRESDRARGAAMLEKIGLRDTDWWVCVHVRSPTYYTEGPGSTDVFRNAEVKTYYKAMKMITDRGGYVFRMGDPSMAPLPKMDRVIDYATSEIRSDWMDVFLCSQCRFYIGTNSGLQLLPDAFEVPSIQSNHLPLLPTPYAPNDVFLPKLLRTGTGRLLTFHEMLKEPYVFATAQNVFNWPKVEIVDNTEDDLLGAVADMLDSLDAPGNRRELPLTGLQGRFKSLVEASGFCLSGRIGADFISRHSELL